MDAIKNYVALVGFAQGGWGGLMISAMMVTIAVSVCGFLVGSVLGTIIAGMKLSSIAPLRWIGGCYTTVLRGVPDLLVVYLFYFGGGALLSYIGAFAGYDGYIGMPAFLTGTVALGIVSAAYQAEVLRGAYRAVSRGELEAADSVGMLPWRKFRRIIVPLVLRYAMPGLGNTWQLVLKESALISVTGLIEILRQSQIAAGSTRKPFEFYLTALVLYLVITWVSSILFGRLENRAMRGFRRAI